MSKPITHTVERTIRLEPSTYEVSSTTYLPVTDASNAYENTDSTTYATITNTNASTTSRYYYLRGFNFNSIPATAIINSFTVKIKGYESGLNTSTSYAPRLANGTSAISNTSASSNFGTSTSIITLSTGTLTWQQIIDYGSNFTILVYVKRSSRATTGYFYCYGAEIEVNYSIDEIVTGYELSFSNSSSITTDPSSITYIVEGENQEILFSGINSLNNVDITDNSIDIKNSLISVQSGTYSQNLIPCSLDSYHGYSDPEHPENGYTDSSSETFARINIRGGGAYLSYAFNKINIPFCATNISVSCEVTARVSATSSSITNKVIQLYSGEVEKGDPIQMGSTVVPGTAEVGGTFTIDGGSWTIDELNNAKVRVSAQYTNTSNYTIKFYGATLTVTYTIPEGVYTYTIYNTSSDHSIVIVSREAIYIKVGGNWVKYSNVYKKVSGSWVMQDLESLFQSNKIYINNIIT
jgi:hypothetical protein